MALYDQYLPQFGSVPPGFNLPNGANYDSMGTWAMPGTSVYTGAANNFQPAPQMDFSQFATPAPTPGFMDGFLGSKGVDGIQTPGWGGMALGAAQGLFGGYMGMKNYGLAKDSLEQGKKQFQMNYDAQKQTTNTALEDRQRARVANNPNSVAVNEYMNQNRIK